MTTTAPRIADRSVTIDGRRFHYLEAGDRHRPTVLVLHGLMGLAREWDTLTGMLASDYRIVALDQRGHGLSDWADQYDASTMASDAIEVIERLELGPVELVGHSMGGMVAMLLAARRPDLVDRLVIIDVAPDSLRGAWADQLPAWVEALGEAAYDSVDEAVELWQSGDPYARASLLRHYAEHNLRIRQDGRYVWRFDAQRLSQFGRQEGAPEELWAAVEAIRAPTLVIRGQHSPVLDLASAQRLVRRLGDGAYAEIPGAGHDLGVQQPERVARAVQQVFPDGSI